MINTNICTELCTHKTGPFHNIIVQKLENVNINKTLFIHKNKELWIVNIVQENNIEAFYFIKWIEVHVQCIGLVRDQYLHWK